MPSLRLGELTYLFWVETVAAKGIREGCEADRSVPHWAELLGCARPERGGRPGIARPRLDEDDLIEEDEAIECQWDHAKEQGEAACCMEGWHLDDGQGEQTHYK